MEETYRSFRALLADAYRAWDRRESSSEEHNRATQIVVAINVLDPELGLNMEELAQELSRLDRTNDGRFTEANCIDMAVACARTIFAHGLHADGAYAENMEVCLDIGPDEYESELSREG